MPLAVDSVISGAYNATWNGLDIGNVQLGGYKLKYAYDERKVQFDAVGSTAVDTLYTGLNMYIDFVCMQYKKQAIESMAWPFSAARGQALAAGFSMWVRAKPLILTACNSLTDPATLTAYKTILAPGFEVNLNHSGVEERMVPLRLIVFPVLYEASIVTPKYPAGCADVVYFKETLQP